MKTQRRNETTEQPKSAIKFFTTVLMVSMTTFAASLTINISGITANDGYLRVILFNASEGFPSNYKNGIRDTSIAKPKGTETVTFANIPAGTYAVSVLHDRNGNKIMDSGLFGIPEEPYGVSKNIHPKTRAPTFEECDFVMKADETTTVSVKMKKP